MRFVESTGARLSWRGLIGLQSGIIGALGTLGWLAVASVWYRRSPWHVPNVLATTFYGESALRHGFTASTLSGVALFLAIYGLLGAFFGMAMRGRHKRPRVTLVAVAAALGWYYLSFGPIWKNVNPLVDLYTPEKAMLIGHIVYGVLLGRYPAYLERAEAQSKVE